ncbi:ABC transporter substrate-binding protein [Xylophilus sp.]|uniref:ABC transporter substrate-binding protein n=1 Tax=Xylophilus sp. TaxID=2653893 RepID=UPI003FCD14FE
MLSRRAAGIAAALSLAPLRAQPRPEKTAPTIAVGGRAAFYYLPLTIAERLGFFRDEGLDVHIADHAGGAPALQSVFAGQADVCAGAFEHTLSLLLRSQPFRAFVQLGRAPQISVGISHLGGRGPRQAEDLRGRRIGVSAPGLSTNLVARMLLVRAGVPQEEVAFVGVGTGAAALEALRGRRIDAISNTDPVMTVLEQRGEVRIVGDTRTLRGTQTLFGGAMPGACLYAPQRFLRDNPVTAQALANGVVRALKWLQTAGPSDLVRAVPEAYMLGDRALYLAAFGKVREAFSLDGLLAEDGARTALSALARFEPAFSATRIDLRQVYTNSFAAKAKARYQA